jgi:hypothetical protein
MNELLMFSKDAQAPRELVRPATVYRPTVFRQKIRE